MEERKIFSVSDLMAAIASSTAKHGTVECEEDGLWAVNSQFYNQVMEDGHIFNPYLHRRFVPSQFLRMMNNKYYSDIKAVIDSWYGFTYSIEWAKDEVRKLAFLQKADPIAFDERKHFLTIDNVKSIIDGYVNAAIQFVDLRARQYRSVKVGKHLYVRNRAEIEKFIEEINDFNNKVQSTITYETMNELLQSHYVIKINNAEKSHDFIEAFERAGAYYTLKHLVMFEHLSLNDKTGADACAELIKYVDESSDVIYDALTKTIAVNNYKL